jgi:hypothetical protein
VAASFEKTIQERPKPPTSARLQPTKSLSHFLSWGCPSSHQLARGKGTWSMTQASHEEVPAQLRCGFAPGGTLPGIPSIPRHLVSHVDQQLGSCELVSPLEFSMRWGCSPSRYRGANLLPWSGATLYSDWTKSVHSKEPSKIPATPRLQVAQDCLGSSEVPYSNTYESSGVRYQASRSSALRPFTTCFNPTNEATFTALSF